MHTNTRYFASSHSHGEMISDITILDNSLTARYWSHSVFVSEVEDGTLIFPSLSRYYTILHTIYI